MTDLIDAAVAAAPDYPMERSAGCPFAPPAQMLEMNQTAPLSRVRIWNGSTPWLVTGHEVARALFADSRVSVDDRREGFPHWNEHMLSTVDKRPRSVFTADAEEHTRFRRMLSKPFTFRRVEALRPVIQEVTDASAQRIAVISGPNLAREIARQVDRAFFGEKDYQQLMVVRRLARDLDIPTEIVGAPTERDGWGLALSSRNAYLSPEDRQRALALSRGLAAAQSLCRSGTRETAALVGAVRRELEAAGLREDYVELVDATSLTPLPAVTPGQPARLLVAAFVGSTRLIDNQPIGG